MKAKLFKRKNRKTKYIKESYEKACEEYEKVGNVGFNLKKYSELQRENKEGKSMGKIKTFLIQVYRDFPYILLNSVLTVRFLSELFKWNVNISNETMVFAIIIALIFF